MAEDNKLLIVGATGFLGRTLCELAPNEWLRVAASRMGDGHRHIDLMDASSVTSAVMDERPRWVINTAAMTSVDGCERDPARAQAIHVDGTRHLVRACEMAGCGLITLSTNYVFDGEMGVYKETDEAHPPNVYGQSKLDGEAVVAQANCQGIVIRTAVLYGHRVGCRPNFVTWAMGALERGEPIRVVTDEWTNPTYVDDLALFILEMCDSDYRGLLHFGGRDFLTRFEMVERICAIMGYDPQLVTPTTSDAFGQPAKRPLRAGLDTGLAAGLSKIKPMGFDDSLLEIQKTYH
ncbi:MAG: SDR family oxidoreductase [Candidatus Latescibacteria bacterium]|jgi:dTDP-4-dehydrorhamnose reductase|nr:SDR family oxidoreductase [Candidatus Latescibacterota bacterium]MBT4136596.1 SDR family oxidoreductase [Candidatus Latescibacterota bacterium]MBT5831958.1 SDR family oxidoreductase [Candidatus Latescibacterota bacterium]